MELNWKSWLKKFSTPELIAMAIVLFAAVGMAFGIRHIMGLRASLKQPLEPVAKRAAVPVELDTEAPQPPIRQVEEVAPVVEEVQQVEEFPDDEPQAYAAQPEPEREPEPGERGNPKELFDRIFDGIEMSDADEERLEQGMELAKGMFTRMSEDDRRQAISELRRERQQWDQMSDSEREGKLLRIREDLNDWRRSGDVELPRSVSATIAIQEGLTEEFGIPKYF